MIKKFFINKNSWDKNIAIYLSLREGIKKLNANHWLVIFFIRNYFSCFNYLPSYRMIMIYMSIYSSKKISPFLIYKLFPKGLVKQGFKIAGFLNHPSCF